jgi:hypothetical protein
MLLGTYCGLMDSSDLDSSGQTQTCIFSHLVGYENTIFHQILSENPPEFPRVNISWVPKCEQRLKNVCVFQCWCFSFVSALEPAAASRNSLNHCKPRLNAAAWSETQSLVGSYGVKHRSKREDGCRRGT